MRGQRPNSAVFASSVMGGALLGFGGMLYVLVRERTRVPACVYLCVYTVTVCATVSATCAVVLFPTLHTCMIDILMYDDGTCIHVYACMHACKTSILIYGCNVKKRFRHRWLVLAALAS